MVGAGRILVDTSFFIALLDKRDRHHLSARKMEEWLNVMPILLPWPILYETVNTRLVRRPESLARFDAIIRSAKTELLDDTPYRPRLLSAQFTRHLSMNRLSLVDAILCSIIEDVNVSVSVMLTFDMGNFLPICQQNNVELLSAP